MERSMATSRPENSAVGAANTAVVITLPQATIRGRYKIGRVAGWYDSTPTGGLLSILGGGFNKRIPVTSSGAGFIPVYEKSDGTSDIVITLAPGGAGVIGYLEVMGVEVV